MFPKVEVSHTIKIKALVTAFQKNLPSDFYYGGEIHDFWEVVYVMEGKIGVTIDDKVYEASKGEMVFHPPKVFHKIWTSSHEETKVFITAFDCSGNLMNAFADDMVITIDSENYNKLNTVMKHFYPIQIKYPNQDFLKSWDLTPYQIQLGAIYLEAFLIQLVQNHISAAKQESESNETDLYKMAISVMNDNIDKDYTVAGIAKLCGTSESNLKRIFSHYSSYGVHKYFLNMKILKAIDMLTDNVSVKDISDYLSFKNPNYFGIVFKRETGYSPITYKNKIIFKNKKINRFLK